MFYNEKTSLLQAARANNYGTCTPAVEKFVWRKHKSQLAELTQDTSNKVVNTSAWLSQISGKGSAKKHTNQDDSSVADDKRTRFTS